ncbi:MAG: hypothetical protein ACRBFS_13930 [Aureispira sp.]
MHSARASSSAFNTLGNSVLFDNLSATTVYFSLLLASGTVEL